MTRTAVVLFNLGAPDCLRATQPFLKNLFQDPAILQLPFGIRHVLAWIISKFRASKALEIYKYLGGRSPLLENTQNQAKALKKILGPNYEVFIAMRYWHPFTDFAVQQVLNYAPDKIILLPLYPQFSTTTTLSSFKIWEKLAHQKNLRLPTKFVTCYPTYPPFIKAIIDNVSQNIDKIANTDNIHLLFTAHSLPQRIIDQGDPYQVQVQQTVNAVMSSPLLSKFPYSLAYQSKVGPIKWIGPFVEETLEKLGKNHKSVMVIPIAFVSEHSETLYELDYIYRKFSDDCGIESYYRVPTVNLNPDFIKGLACLCYTFDDEKKMSSYHYDDPLNLNVKNA